MAHRRGIIINAASVGEVAEAESLIRALHSLAPDLEFLITTGNRDGRIRASRVAKTGGPRIRTCYL
ncbi:MAG: hypothetical protein OEV30_08970, partial [Ignavibacteria bacterium]|nr:hypothetical protein [Ignavibacteria bacterium]